MLVHLDSRCIGFPKHNCLLPCLVPAQDLGGTGSSGGGEAGAPAASKAGSGGAPSGDAAVRAVLTDLLGRLPAPFSLVDIESRIKTRTPFVVLALQVRWQGKRGLMVFAALGEVICALLGGCAYEASFLC